MDGGVPSYSNATYINCEGKRIDPQPAIARGKKS